MFESEHQYCWEGAMDGAMDGAIVATQGLGMKP